MKGRSFFIVAMMLLTACGPQAPQRPSQRKNGDAQSARPTQADERTLSLLEMNQQLTESADRQLHHIAREQEESYALYEQGTWVHVYEYGDTDRPILLNREYTVHMRVYSLQGTFYLDAEQSGIAGKYELPACIDENCTEWNHGAHLRLLAPWYAAFGIQGTAKIPPYENVIIDLEIR